LWIILREEEHEAPLGEKRNAYRVSMGNLEIKSPLGRRERRWEDNIKMYP
jgi:hypothetical protein